MKTKRRKVAKYWQYTGNHPNGKNCKRYDPHNLGLDVIARMHYIATHEYSYNGVLLSTVIVRYSKSDGFGRVITISAYPDQWEAIKE